MSEREDSAPVTPKDRYRERYNKTKKHFMHKIRQGGPVEMKRGEAYEVFGRIPPPEVARRSAQHEDGAAAAAEPKKGKFPSLFDDYPSRRMCAMIFEDTMKYFRDSPDAKASAKHSVMQKGLIAFSAPVVESCAVNFEYKTTLQCIRDFYEKTGIIPGVLNFASAKNPGGGVENGAIAQEESLCRSSSLFLCLKDKPEFYELSIKNPRHGAYHDAGIFSPNVMIIKDDYGNIVAPHRAHFLTVAAVNRYSSECSDAEYDDVMIRRCEFVLNMAECHGVRDLILGAFGCGVFRNDPHLVAETFANLLRGRFAYKFRSVTFAIPNERQYHIFKQYF